jgi:peptidoglycan pentaglycine glycine transferase (the first glycine)
MESNLNKELWDKKVIDLGGSILQSYAWGEFQQALGYKVHRFSSDNFVNQVVELPLVASKKYLYSARGPLGNVPDAQSDLRKLAAADHEIIFARIEPNEKINLPRSVKDTQPTNNWVLDLNQTEEELLIKMKPKTRYNINLAQRKNVRVRQGSKEDLLIVYKLLLETAGRGNFRLHPQEYYWQAWETLSPENLKILISEYNGLPLGCVILTLFGSTVTYLHGGSSNQLKESMAPYLLHWEAIKLSKNLGFSFYDFGGVAPEDAGRHPWSGISRFKRGFGGFEVIYPGSFEMIFSPVWYNIYKNLRSFRNLIRKK